MEQKWGGGMDLMNEHYILCEILNEQKQVLVSKLKNEAMIN